LVRVGVEVLPKMKLFLWLNILDDWVGRVNLNDLDRLVKVVIKVVVKFVHHLLRKLKLLVNQRSRLGIQLDTHPNLGPKLDSFRVSHPEGRGHESWHLRGCQSEELSELTALSHH
jgi:hypothetical protein